ncbi:hypothetical protein [Nocardiopsis sp. MG754419]|uniref:hypothetical protein n=1 Tax=Nocardiopsis sp. MG754419 TaxID=2259865 RepID=UPI001BA8E75C|nr:hypothetical protein [Nocardiopsis sp. MG754419]MBR8743923.1 hypothetical protein [Nocardiopsis sp. MG754419]
MSDTTGPAPVEDTAALRSMLRADLTTAMKARRRDSVAALRTTIAALDNAEAVPVRGAPAETTGAHIAGAEHGVGSTEARRRALTLDEALSLLRAQIEERTSEADRYASLGAREDAERLRREADALRAYTATHTTTDRPEPV